MFSKTFLFIKLAWRNIFRNKRRTIITSISIGIGISAIIFTDALIFGMKENMIKSATSTFMGEGQIHNKVFLDKFQVVDTVYNSKAIINNLKEEDIIKAFTPRTLSLSTIATAANIKSISLIGIDRELEVNISKIEKAIIEGEFLDGEDERDIIIGEKLAEDLEAKIGTRIVVSVSQCGSDAPYQEMFRVSGIYSFGINELDDNLAYISITKAQEILGIGEAIHEIAFNFTNIKFSEDTNLDFWGKYSQNNNIAESWTQLVPNLQGAFKMAGLSITIIGFILFFIVALGIVNTMYMSIYERFFEFGVLRAIGTRKREMFKLIVFEAASLSIFSIFIGILLSLLVLYLTNLSGINYSGIEYSGVYMQDNIYPLISLKQFVLYPIILFILTIIISLIPAIQVAKILPAEALRKWK